MKIQEKEQSQKVIVTFYITYPLWKIMQPFNFYIINFSKIKTVFIKCLFAMPPIIYVNNMSLIATWNELRSATRTFFAYGCSHCRCKIFYEYWITHLGFRMRGCDSHYVYCSVNCISCKLLLHFFTLQNSIKKKAWWKFNLANLI